MKDTKKGFTITELMLAMAFLATMLIGISALVVRVSNIYQKGLSLRAVNSIGREIISDLTRTINGSRIDVEINPDVVGGKISLKQINAALSKYFVESKDNEGRQLGGAFCTGSYSYLWNTADSIRTARTYGSDESTEGSVDGVFIEGGSAVANMIANKGVYVIATRDGRYFIPKLVRFDDQYRNTCKNIADSTYIDMSDEATGKNYSDFISLIEDNESDLALYDLSILPASKNNATKHIFYSGTFILATYKGGVNIKSNGDFCQGSADENGGRGEEFSLNDFDYCAVNKFNFSARATGETSIDQYGGR